MDRLINYPAIGANEALIKLARSEYVRWAVYKPGKIEDDIPMGIKWWTICYWLEVERKNIYELLLKTNASTVENYLYDVLGIDEDFLNKYFPKFLKRVRIMEKLNKVNHLGESKNG